MALEPFWVMAFVGTPERAPTSHGEPLGASLSGLPCPFLPLSLLQLFLAGAAVRPFPSCPLTLTARPLPGSEGTWQASRSLFTFLGCTRAMWIQAEPSPTSPGRGGVHCRSRGCEAVSLGHYPKGHSPRPPSSSGLKAPPPPRPTSVRAPQRPPQPSSRADWPPTLSPSPATRGHRRRLCRHSTEGLGVTASSAESQFQLSPGFSSKAGAGTSQR